LDQLEKRNKRLTVALTMTVVAIAAVVTMAATGEKDGRFDTVMADTVVARHIGVLNEAGQVVVGLGTSDDGDGLVNTRSAKGKPLVELGSGGGNGTVTTYQPNGKMLVELGATADGEGTVINYQPNGIELVRLGAADGGGAIVTYQPTGYGGVPLHSTENGGLVYVFNKTSESIAQMRADEYGNGVVWAGKRMANRRIRSSE
jgi:hypothetical protein